MLMMSAHDGSGSLVQLVERPHNKWAGPGYTSRSFDISGLIPSRASLTVTFSDELEP